MCITAKSYYVLIQQRQNYTINMQVINNMGRFTLISTWASFKKKQSATIWWQIIFDNTLSDYLPVPLVGNVLDMCKFLHCQLWDGLKQLNPLLSIYLSSSPLSSLQKGYTSFKNREALCSSRWYIGIVPRIQRNGRFYQYLLYLATHWFIRVWNPCIILTRVVRTN